jgi:hypothetical protein
MTYTPRRAGKRWQEGAPEYILDVFDNKGKTFDRYTVLFCGSLLGWMPLEQRTYANTYIQYLDMSDNPTHPQGFSQWGEMTAPQAAAYRYRDGHQRIRWLDLPEHIRKHVIARAA